MALGNLVARRKSEGKSRGSHKIRTIGEREEKGEEASAAEREREREREKDQNRLDRRAWRASIIDARVLTSINESAKRSAEPEHAVERISKLPGELTVLNIYIFFFSE